MSQTSPRPARERPSAFDRLPELPPPSRLAIFLDYDGTLTPIVSRPEDAVLTAAMRERVGRLARECRLVAIVSGRDQAEVRSLVDVPGIGYVGSHGFDIAPPTGPPHVVGEEFGPALDAAEATLRSVTADIEGALVERKRFSVATHYRLVDESDHPRVEDAVARVAANEPKLRRAGGKAVHELKPAIEWDKGRAVLWMLRTLGAEDATAIHIGDDLTDETVFAVLRDGDVGIHVGRGDERTLAPCTLEDPDEVGALLDELCSPSATER